MYKRLLLNTLLIFNFGLYASSRGGGGAAASEAVNFDPELYRTILEGSTQELEQYLVSDSSRVNEANEFGHTPLHFAISTRSLAKVQLLISHGASASIKSKSSKSQLRLIDGQSHRLSLGGLFEITLDEQIRERIYDLSALHYAVYINIASFRFIKC